MTRRRRTKLRRAPRALTLIAFCFIGSSAVRVVNADPASVQQAAALAASVSAAAGLSGAPRDAAAAPAECPTIAGANELLEAIREREEQLSARADEIADRGRVLEVVEAKAREQLAAMAAAEQSLKDTLALADRAAEKDIMNLVAVYETMKPKSAAPIFDAMDVQFAAGFLSRMRKDAAAEILAGMTAERAYSVSVVIASQNARVPKE